MGKAVNLKSRVTSYFSGELKLGEKTRQLVSQIYKIKIVIVESEIEALLLEAFYIKKYNPRYNIRLTDSKSYLIVRITIKDAYPKVLLTRKIENKNDIYFGPFPNSSAVKLVLKTIRRAFPYQSVLNHPKRICLYYHLGLCPCPAMFQSTKSKQIYRKNIKNIIRIFNGKTSKIIKELEKERNNLSFQEKFEEANIIQQKLNALSYIRQPLHKPQEYDINPNLRSDLRQEETNELIQVLNNNHLPITSINRIECYDISNIQGTYAVGSMIVFNNGEKETSSYRKFRVRLKNKPDDFAMIKEILGRRFKHQEWNLPDLIIIDGGKGQVSSAMSVLQNLNLKIPLIGLAKKEETIIIPKTRNTKLEFIEVLLPKDSKALHLIMRIRDEAHRFAITYHRKLRSKAITN